MADAKSGEDAGLGPREVVLLEVGEMFMTVQRFEQFLLAALLGMVSDADAKLQAVLLRDRATLGVLLKEFAARVDLPANFAEAYERVLERRNVFVHKLFMQPWFGLRTAQDRQCVREYMRQFRADMKVALHVLIAVAHTNRSQDSPAVSRCIADILERIQETASPDFGGLSEDEYVRKVLGRALDQYQVRLKA